MVRVCLSVFVLSLLAVAPTAAQDVTGTVVGVIASPDEQG